MKIGEVIRRVTDKYFSYQHLKKMSSRKTCLTNRIKRHTKIRDTLFQLWLKCISERAHLKHKDTKTKTKETKSLWKINWLCEQTYKTKLIIKIPYNSSIIVEK